MFKMRAKVTGFSELSRKLEKIAHAAGPRPRDLALGDAAELVLAKMQQYAPVLTGDLRNSLAIMPGEKRDEVRVGPAGRDAWRAHFIEFGTIYSAAQPFIRPAFDVAQGEMVKAISRRMETSIRNAAKGG